MNKQELQSRLDLLYSERKDIESQIEFSSSRIIKFFLIFIQNKL